MIRKSFDLSRLLGAATGALERSTSAWRRIVERGQPTQIEPTDAEEMADFFDAMRLNLVAVEDITAEREVAFGGLLRQQIATFNSVATLFVALRDGANVSPDGCQQMATACLTSARAAAETLLAMQGGTPWSEPAAEEPVRPALRVAASDGELV